jgi:hypothetical protein
MLVVPNQNQRPSCQTPVVPNEFERPSCQTPVVPNQFERPLCQTPVSFSRVRCGNESQATPSCRPSPMPNESQTRPVVSIESCADRVPNSARRAGRVLCQARSNPCDLSHTSTQTSTIPLPSASNAEPYPHARRAHRWPPQRPSPINPGPTTPCKRRRQPQSCELFHHRTTRRSRPPPRGAPEGGRWAPFAISLASLVNWLGRSALCSLAFETNLW